MTWIFEHEFMRNALAAGLLVSIGCGVIGSFVVLNRMVFISAGVAHAAYGGIGLGYFFGFSPVIGAVGFSVVAALGMGAIERRAQQRVDTVIGVIWAAGMALGILLIDLSEGYKADLMSYLFGSILAIPLLDLWFMLALDGVIVLLTILYFKELLAMSFDENFTRIQNVPVDRIHLVLQCMIGLTVVMMMRVVGLILVIALLTIPPAISALFTRDMRRMMILASLLGMVFTTVGLVLSFTYDLTSGASIIMVSAVAYFLALVLRRRGSHAAD